MNSGRAGPDRSCRAPVMAVLIAVMAVSASPSAGQTSPDQYAGRRLADALKILQTRGLRLVFSSEIVTPEMRVAVEPRATSARKVLDELLQPHDLSAREGPGRVIQIVRAKRPVKSARVRQATPPRRHLPCQRHIGARDRHRRRDRIRAQRRFLGAPSVAGTAGSGGRAGRRPVAGGPHASRRGNRRRLPQRVLRAWQRLPSHRRGRRRCDDRLAPACRVRTQRTGIGRDAQQQWRRQADAAVRGLRAAPRRPSWRRSGSDAPGRVAREDQLSRSGDDSAFDAGRRGADRSRSQRGSWLATIRNSHRDWPIRTPRPSSGTVLGFSDAQAKLVYDVSTAQQVSASVLVGRSSADELDEQQELEGASRVTLATLGWRSTFGSRTSVSQRVSTLMHAFDNDVQAGQSGETRLRGSVRVSGRRGQCDCGRPAGSWRADPARAAWRRHSFRAPHGCDRPIRISHGCRCRG